MAASHMLRCYIAQKSDQKGGAFALVSIAALLPPLLLVLGTRWSASVALGFGLGAALLLLLKLRCVHGPEVRLSLDHLLYV